MIAIDPRISPGKHIMIMSNRRITPSDQIMIMSNRRITPSDQIMTMSSQRITSSDRIVIMSDRRITPSDQIMIMSDRRITPSDQIVIISDPMSAIDDDIGSASHHRDVMKPAHAAARITIGSGSLLNRIITANARMQMTIVVTSTSARRPRTNAEPAIAPQVPAFYQ